MAPLSSSMSSSLPPISPYGTLTGQLFLYASNRAAFESSVGDAANDFCRNKCILLGGLSDGLLPTPYTQGLEQVCVDANWSLVQPILSSSYTNELNELCNYLVAHRNCHCLALIGHSTGCQNIIHFLKHGDPVWISKVRLAVLQAPVSDREHAMMESSTYQRNLEMALNWQKQGKEEELMPRQAFWAPITAQRFLDLQQRGGADDFFRLIIPTKN